MSKFHLLRTFRRRTSVTPGRFLAAVRLQEAKQMLHDTSLNVADIATQVGYSSTGSFTRRFTDAVGLSPIRYRRMSRGECFDQVRREPQANHFDSGVITGVVDAPHPISSPILVGAFTSPILQGEPRASVLMHRPGPFEITGLPSGRWYLHAVARCPGASEPSDAHPDAPLLAGCAGPVTTTDCRVRRLSSDLVLLPPAWSDPPILFALLGLTSTRTQSVVGA